MWFFFYRILLKGVIEKVVRYHNGAWQKVNFVVLADKSLQRVENVFECVVKLPQTAYTVRRTMLYTPSKCITVNTMGWYPLLVSFLLHLKFVYSKKATKFCKIFTLLLTTVHTVKKSKVKILQNFVAFSEYKNFTWWLSRI